MYEISEQNTVSILTVKSKPVRNEQKQAARRYVPPRRQFLSEPHCARAQKPLLFMIAAVKTSYPAQLV
jgi:hypothetical protein